MIVITDSNLIFSALITPRGTVAKILKEQNRIQFFVPNFVFDEIKNHFDKILFLCPYSKLELIEQIKILKAKIKIIETKTIPKEYIVTATEIVKDIDPKDMFFVALNLYKKHKIWTGDKPLRDGLEKKVIEYAFLHRNSNQSCTRNVTPKTKKSRNPSKISDYGINICTQSGT